MKVVNPLLERCFQLIEFLAEEPRAYRLGVISERLGLQKGAVHRLLAALCSMGWAEQEPETGFYRLTLRLALMGQRVLLATRIPDLAAPIRPSGPNTPAVATCSVAGPLMRFGAEDIVRHASLVMEAANEIAAIWPLRSAQTQTDSAAALQLRDESRVAS